MAPPVKEETSIPEMRTYAGDVRRAQKAYESMPGAPDESPQSANESPNVKAVDIKTTGSAGVAMPHGSQTALAQAERTQASAVPVIGQDADIPESHDDDSKTLDIREESSDKQKGVIVKDSRSKQWSFTKEVGEAFSDWIASLTGSNKKPVSIAPASSRAPIIKAASAESKIAPQDDHSSLALRTKQSPDTDEENEDNMLRTIPDRQKPNWTYIDPQEKQKNLKEIEQILAGLENREPRRQGSPSIKRRRPVIRAEEASEKYAKEDVMPKEKEEMVSPDAPPAADENPQEEPGEIENEPAEEEAIAMMPNTDASNTQEQPEQQQEEEVVREVVPARQKTEPPAAEETVKYSEDKGNAAAQSVPTTAAHVEDVTEQKNEANRPEVPKHREPQERVPASTEPASIANEMQSTGPRAGDLYALRAEEKARTGAAANETAVPFKMYLGGAVIALAIAGAVFAGYYVFTNRGSEAPRTSGIVSLFSTNQTVTVQLPEGRSQILSELSSHVRSATGNAGSLIRYELTEQETGRVFATQAFLNTLGRSVPGTLVRTAYEPFMFGAYLDAQNAPFIAFPVRNRDAAYAGMLEWERSMYSDLSPLFGDELDGMPEFRDEVVSSFDARVLYDETGSVHIMYALVDNNTIVISTSRSALSAVIRALGGR